MGANHLLIAEIVDDLRRVFQVVNEHSKRVEQDTGLTGPQLWAIKVISDHAQIKVSELACKMYLHPATVIRILDRLESRGLVIRNRSLTDRRVVNVELSEQGKKLVHNSPEVAQGLLVKGMESLATEDLNTITSGLKKLVKILGAQEIPPKLILSNIVNVAGEEMISQIKRSKVKAEYLILLFLQSFPIIYDLTFDIAGTAM